jgi:ABC-type sugar transport system substrate-binding protein
MANSRLRLDRTRTAAGLALGLSGVLALTGCGGSSSSSAGTSSATSAAAATSAVAAAGSATSAAAATGGAATSAAAASGGAPSATAAGGASTAATTAATTSHTDKHIAFVYAATNEDFAQEMALGAQNGATITGVSFTETAPPAIDGAAEVTAFNAALNTSKDGIAMETLTPQLMVRPLQQATSSKVTVIAVDTPPPAGTTTALFIGNSNYQLGVELANALLPKIPAAAKGQILIGTDTVGLPVLVARNNGFMDTVKKVRPGVTFVNFNSMQTPTENYNNWSAAVKAHPNALAFVGPGSQDAASMAQIERQTGKKYLVGADDLDPTALNGIKTGLVTVLISPEHWLKGYIATYLLAQHAISGAAIPSGWWNPGYLVVNSANVDAIIARQKDAASRAAYFAPIVKKQLADPSAYIKPLSAIS